MQYSEAHQFVLEAFEAIETLETVTLQPEQVDVAIAIRMIKQGVETQQIAKVLCQSSITQRINAEHSPLAAVEYVQATQQQAQQRLEGVKAKQGKHLQDSR